VLVVLVVVFLIDEIKVENLEGFVEEHCPDT